MKSAMITIVPTIDPPMITPNGIDFGVAWAAEGVGDGGEVGLVIAVIGT